LCRDGDKTIQEQIGKPFSIFRGLIMVWYNLVMKNYIRAEIFLFYYSFTGDISSPRQARLNIRLMKQAVQQQQRNILHYTPYGMAYHRSYHEFFSFFHVLSSDCPPVRSARRNTDLMRRTIVQE